MLECGDGSYYVGSTRDLDQRACVAHAVGHSWDIADLAVSPDGTYALTTAHDVMHRWELDWDLGRGPG